MIPDFTQFSLWINIAIFVVAAVFVWRSGYRISIFADIIATKTGLGHALMGLLFLGGITSLPELAVAVSAASSGNGVLAVNNLLGGVTMQVAILAVADFAIGRRALTAMVPDSVVMLQGALNIVLLCLVVLATLVGDYALWGIGLWSWAIALCWVLSMWVLSKEEQRQPWIAEFRAAEGEKKHGEGREPDTKPEHGKAEEHTLSDAVVRSIVAAAIILVAGFIVTRTGEAIAEQSGLGASFMGAVFIAFATSLPEVSTVLSAVRFGLYTMAISDILGTNLFDLALVFIVDAVAAGDPVLGSVGVFASVAGVLAIAVTALYVAGLAERRDWSFMRMSVDSLAVLAVYAGGVVLLYTLR